MTPYPANNNSFENPSMLVSNDGDTWIVPPGLTNPIVAKPVGGNNSDVDIFMASDGVTMWMIYRDSVSPNDALHVISSTDGVTWSAPTTILSGAGNLLVSPAIIYNATPGLYQMWHMDVRISPYRLYYRTASTPDGAWSAATLCDIQSIAGKDWWHIDVQFDPVTGHYQAFVMVTNSGSNGLGGKLYFGESLDGLTWCLTALPVLDVDSPGAWDSERIYRSSGIRLPDGYDLFYGAASDAIPSVWRIGRTKLVGI